MVVLRIEEIDVALELANYLIYLTGLVFVKVAFLGKVRVAPLSTINKKLAKSKRGENGLWIRYNRKKYLHAGNALGIGMVIWIVSIITALVVAFTHS